MKVRPYLMGDCAFTLAENMIKTTSTFQQENDLSLMMWERVAAATRNPIECAFAKLKHRFALLKDGLQMRNEDDCARVIMAFFIIHNTCIGIGDSGEDFLQPDDEDIPSIEIGNETRIGK